MSKRVFALALAFITLFLVGCTSIDSDSQENTGIGGGNMNRGDGFVLKAVVKEVRSDLIEVEVIESDYAFGIYWVRTGDQTEYNFADGSSATRSDIKAGQNISISYNGQTMMSLPPQIVAHGIVIE